MNKIMNKIMLLMLVTSILITTANALSQTLTIDVTPDNAGTVQVWKIFDYKTPTQSAPIFIGSTRTKIDLVLNPEDFTESTGDVIVIMPLDDLPSEYKYVKQCDHLDCLTGKFIGYLYTELSEYKVTVYYEIPSDKENPKINGITTNPRNPNVGDYIYVYVSATDNIGVDSVTVDNMPTEIGESYWTGKIMAREGTHNIGVMVCDLARNCVQDVSVQYTAIANSIPTPTPPTTPPIQDNEKPTIISVNLDPSTTYIGNIITITVNAVDNVAVTNITADGNPMSFYDRQDIDKYWQSDMIAVEGTHYVLIEAKDAAGNIAKDDSAKYTATLQPNETIIKTSSHSSKGLIPLVTNTPKKIIFGKLFVDSDPQNATIYINKVSSGLTAKDFELPIGGYEIKIIKKGYKEYIKKIIITELEIAEVTVKLIKLNETGDYTNSTTTSDLPNTDTKNTETDSSKQDEKLNDKKTTSLNDDKNNITIALIILAILLFGSVYYMYSKTLKENKTLVTDSKSVGIIEKIKKLITDSKSVGIIEKIKKLIKK